LKKPIYIITLLIFCCFAFWSCEKKLFKKAEVSGRVTNIVTNVPLPGITITLWSNFGTQNPISLGSTTTDGDGTFFLRTPAVYNENYTLMVSQPPNVSSSSSIINVWLKDNKDIDVGVIQMGVFNGFCKVIINSVTGSAIDFKHIELNHKDTTLHFNAGTSTQFITNYFLDYNSGNGGIGLTLFPYQIFFTTYPGGVATNNSVSVPITSPDTLSVTINY
jgi:hypothetical protein